MAKRPAPRPPARRRPAPTRARDDNSGAIAASSGGVRPPKLQRGQQAGTVTEPNEDKEGARLWGERLVGSQKTYKDWSDEYLCSTLDDYYKGKQWHGLSETERQRKYVINMVFATVETQLPTLLFSRPVVNCEARPSTATTPGTDAGKRAELIKETLQTFLDDPKVRFTFETTLALRNAYSRFAIVEVGYTADFIDNPNAGRPILEDDGITPKMGSDGAALKEPARKLREGTESAFVKRLRPQNFRVSGSNRNRLEANDWCAYSEWVYVEDLKKNKHYENTRNLKPTGRLANGEVPDDTREDDASQSKAGMCKMWRIWDLRAKVRHVYVEGHDRLLQRDKPFKVLPLAVLKFYELEDSFFPLPPIFNWLGPQDEINETREMQKVHRRRALRRYMRLPSVDKTEFDKLESAPDMAAIEVPSMDAIKPIEDAELGAQIFETLAVTKDDFAIVSGVSGEARSTAEADTATQANIINTKQALRETAARIQVAQWLGQICRLALFAIREHVNGPLMVKRSVDWFAEPQGQAGDAKDTAETWKKIKAEDIDELDVDISIDVTSLSPVAEEAARNAWTAFLGLLTNQPLGIYLFTPHPDAPTQPSPLFRKTANLYGIKSERELLEIWRVGTIVLAGQAAAAQAQIAAQTDKPHATWSFKGPDLEDPLVLAAFVKAEGLQDVQKALALQKQQAPPMDGGGSSAMPELAGPAAAPASGQPAQPLAPPATS